MRNPLNQKTGKRYEVTIPFTGIYFDSSHGRSQYTGELKKYVTPTFGSALVEADATINVDIFDDTIEGGVEVVFVDIASVFINASDAKDNGAEDDCVDVEIYMENAQFAASPEALAAWAKEHGWDLYDWSGPDVGEDED